MIWDGGREAGYKRLQDPAMRAKIAKAIRTPANDWENLYLLSGSPDRILLASFKSEKLKPLTGKTLAEVAKMRSMDPVETIMDLVLEDRSHRHDLFPDERRQYKEADSTAVGFVRFGCGIDCT